MVSFDEVLLINNVDVTSVCHRWSSCVRYLSLCYKSFFPYTVYSLLKFSF